MEEVEAVLVVLEQLICYQEEAMDQIKAKNMVLQQALKMSVELEEVVLKTKLEEEEVVYVVVVE